VIAICCGPTIEASEASTYLDGSFFPPAKQGDIYRISQQRPYAIGIIDGYFDSVPSVWHKEILWALSRGITVFGSASMGALRAAELHQFGMVGIGQVFERFRDGGLEDDDEVAIWHGVDDSGRYRAFSDAMVDIRCSLERARESGIISDAAMRGLIAVAKRMHFRDRSYSGLLQAARASGIVTGAECEILKRWLQVSGTSQKKLDAIEMLVHMARWSQAKPHRFVSEFTFEYTIMWNELRAVHGEPTQTQALGDGDLSLNELLDEIRLRPGANRELLRQGLLRLLTGREERRNAPVLREESIATTIERFRRDRGLVKKSQFDQWRLQQRLQDDADLINFFTEEHYVSLALSRNEPNVRGMLINVLRSYGTYAEVISRASHKHQVLSTRRLSSDVVISDSAVEEWYHSSSGTSAAREDPEYFLRLGFSSRGDFLAAIRREYAYRSELDKARG
jgi:hypothetical protein